jgi:hypothetical protein
MPKKREPLEVVFIGEPSEEALLKVWRIILGIPEPLPEIFKRDGKQKGEEAPEKEDTAQTIE